MGDWGGDCPGTRESFVEMDVSRFDSGDVAFALFGVIVLAVGRKEGIDGARDAVVSESVLIVFESPENVALLEVVVISFCVAKVSSSEMAKSLTLEAFWPD